MSKQFDAGSRSDCPDRKYVPCVLGKDVGDQEIDLPGCPISRRFCEKWGHHPRSLPTVIPNTRACAPERNLTSLAFTNAVIRTNRTACTEC